MKTVAVIVPAYNEEEYIAETLTAIKGIEAITQILVIDDGSTDKTAEIANRLGAEVIKFKKNLGKGTALSLGCLLVNTELVALLDADLGTSAIELHKLLKPVMDNKADISIAIFPKRPVREGFGFVKALAALSISILTRGSLKAPLSGQRVMNRKALAQVLPFESGYGAEVMACVKALRKGLIIQEVETNMTHRVTGRNLMGFMHRGKQFYHILLSCLRYCVKGT